MRFVLTFLFLIIAGEVKAQNFCPILETVQFASSVCVPSTNETCHSGQPGNCEVRGAETSCRYIAGAATHIKTTSLRAGFECTSWAQPAEGEPSEGGGPPQQGPCVQWAPPMCQEKCEKCYQHSITRMQPIRGCVKFCAEESCSDEPRCDPDPCPPGAPCNQNDPCPPGPIVEDGISYIHPLQAWPQCTTNQSCPATYSLNVLNGRDQELLDCIAEHGLIHCCPNCAGGTIVNGQYVPVSVETPTCTPPTIVPGGGQQNDSCPWIEYEKRQPLCAPVEVGNRFPQDCCVCKSDPQPGVNCKNCGAVKAERCAEN